MAVAPRPAISEAGDPSLDLLHGTDAAGLTSEAFALLAGCLTTGQLSCDYLNLLT
jgi:hypothetical protein